MAGKVNNCQAHYFTGFRMQTENEVLVDFSTPTAFGPVFEQIQYICFPVVGKLELRPFGPSFVRARPTQWMHLSA